MKNNHVQCAATSTPRLRTVAIAFAVMLALTSSDAFAQDRNVRTRDVFTVLPTVITSVTVVPGGFMAHGLVGSTPFDAPLRLTSGPLAAAATCPILNLELGAVHLNLLGLNVDTSDICLDITAIQGAGLLGDLLCAIANLLNGGLSIDAALATLEPADVTVVTNGLTQILNQAVFIPASRSTALQSASCNVLNLALGPLDLNLLGLRVELDDCDNGPVTIDITADPDGGLLGDLLCSLGNAFNNNLNTRAVAILRRITDVIGGLLG